MNKIETANIKLASFATNLSKNKKENMSKEDFIEKLEFFIEKEASPSFNKESKSTSKKEEAIQILNKLKNSEEEKAEEIPLIFNFNWLNLEEGELTLSNNTFLKEQLSSIDKKTLDQQEKFSYFKNISQSINEEISLDINSELKEVFLEKLVDQENISDIPTNKVPVEISDYPEYFGKEKIKEIETLLNDYMQEDFDKQEKTLGDIDLADIQLKKGKSSFISRVNKEFEHFEEPAELLENIRLSSKKELLEKIKDVSNENKEEKNSLNFPKNSLEKSFKLIEEEKLTGIVENSRDNKDITEEKPLFSVEKTGEASISTDNKNIKNTIQKVSQKDFVSKLESLVLDQEEILDTSDKITRARIQLTPEKLGKVDLKIEMQGKDLIARLVVEQKETKEWVDQQLSFLKKQLLFQEIHVKDFQVLVHQENMEDTMMNQQDNPFFKQKQEETAKRREKQSHFNTEKVESQTNQLAKRYSRTNGVSIFA